ncbi:MAG: hypothetical protein ACJ8F7_00225 [Gemmataceae bacterium]
MAPLKYTEIIIPHVFQRVGVVDVVHEIQSDLRPKRPFEAKQYGLMVHWPRRFGWLDIQISHGEQLQDFKGNREGLVEVCRAVGADANHVGPSKFLETQSYQVACVNRESPLRFLIRIDTDHEGFRQEVLAQPGAMERECFQVALQVNFFDAKHLGVFLNQEGTVVLQIQPALPVPPLNGFVALDLGNTNSTLVSLALPDAHYRTGSIKLVDADGVRGELVEHGNSVASNVKITNILTYEPYPEGTRRYPTLPKDDFAQTVKWHVGWRANPPDNAAGDEAATMGLILGAKRLIAGKEWEKAQKLKALHWNKNARTELLEQVEILNRLPAELLVCRLLQRFREAAHAWPGELAVTYPTTYSPRELEQLREVVQRAWLRMQSRPQTPQETAAESDADTDRRLEQDSLRLQQLIHARRTGLEPGEDPVVRLMVDEASAAAFFYLYRRIFEQPGGLPRFRYLYPAGLNMLLYDCGGGTTDIALVRAGSDPDDADVLRIAVLARSGLRGFGGDDITRAVCRLLKAKIALKVAQARGRPVNLNWPAAPSAGADRFPHYVQQKRAIEDLFASLKEIDPRDDLVPTTFDPSQTDDATNRRRDHAFDLWRWGELLKAKLARSESAAFMKIDRNLNRLSAALLKGLSDVQAAPLVGQLEKITIQRWEVDALVEQQVLKSIRNCNNLIRDKLLSPKIDQEEPLHWVVISGGASLYPLIQEMLRKLIEPQFIDDDRFTLDEKNLKHAVAKGAVLALSTIMAGTARIEFPSDLSNCLPFDVAFMDQRNNAYPILYREHTRYDALASRTIPLSSLRGGTAAPARKLENFVLERRFPGDDDFQPYLAFHFPDGIQSDLEVAYDPQSREFTVRDTQPNVFGAAKEVTDASVYRSPAQRGDL